MPVMLTPPGEGANTQQVLGSLYDAVSDLQVPDAPTQFASVDLKVATSTATGLPPAADWPNCAIICAEISALVCSTQVAGTWTWLRSDGSAL